MDYKKVKCPDCGRTLAHYLEGDNSRYKLICQRCKNKILIYSAGKTALLIETKIEIEISASQ